MEVLRDVEALNGIRQRLTAVQDCPEIRLAGPEALGAVLAMRDTVHKAVGALNELAEQLQDVQADVPDTRIPASLLDELSAFRHDLRPISQALDELATKSKLSGYPLILSSASILYRSSIWLTCPCRRVGLSILCHRPYLGAQGVPSTVVDKIHAHAISVYEAGSDMARREDARPS